MNRKLFYRVGLLSVAAGLAAGGSLLLKSEPKRVTASAVGEEDLTVIPGFSQYRLTPLRDEAEVKEVYKFLRDDITFNPWNVCSDRANVWSYQMQQTRQINSGKVFLFYTASPKVFQGKKGPYTAYTRSTGNPENRPWLWHVAPYVVADNKMWVMENFAYVRQPLEMKEWLKVQSNGAECVEVKRSDNAPDITSQICGGLNKNGTCTGSRRLIRVAEDGPKCYFVRLPMYYWFPSSVGNAIHLKNPELQTWTSGSVYSACYNSMPGRKKQRRNRCSTFVNNPMVDLNLGWAPPAEYFMTPAAPAAAPEVPASTPAGEIPTDTAGNFVEPLSEASESAFAI